MQIHNKPFSIQPECEGLLFRLENKVRQPYAFAERFSLDPLALKTMRLVDRVDEKPCAGGGGLDGVFV